MQARPKHRPRLDRESPRKQPRLLAPPAPSLHAAGHTPAAPRKSSAGKPQPNRHPQKAWAPMKPTAPKKALARKRGPPPNHRQAPEQPQAPGPASKNPTPARCPRRRQPPKPPASQNTHPWTRSHGTPHSWKRPSPGPPHPEATSPRSRQKQL